MRLALTMRQAALAVALGAAATIGGALVFEHVFGYVPCKLCLMQRNPYYLAIPLGLAAALLPPRWARIGLWLLALTFIVSAGLGAYHSGVEWGFFAGPSDCGGGHIDTALSEAQQGQSWLRLSPELRDATVDLLGLR